MIDFRRFSARFNQLSSLSPAPENVEEHWIEGLYVQLYPPAGDVNDVLLIYHGGGVNADAGYAIPAARISAQGAVCVCLIDIRGHGRSSGLGGDVASPRQIWRDVDTVLEAVVGRFPRARMHLLGHSSGGGMLINYFTCHSPRYQASSLILLAPAFGPFAPASIIRTGAMPFSSVNKWPFIVNALTAGKLWGSRPAVNLHFPADVLNSELKIIETYSVNMANALTPRQPARQLSALALPVSVFLAEWDELTDSKQAETFIKGCANRNITLRIIEKSDHLGAIFDACDAIRHHLDRLGARSAVEGDSPSCHQQKQNA